MQDQDKENQENSGSDSELELSVEFGEQDDDGPQQNLLEAIHGLSSQVRTLAEEFEAKLRYDEHKNRIIDGLHQELQQYREGLIKKHFHSMITDAIKIVDDIRKMKAHYEYEPPTEESLPSLLGFLEDIASDIEDLFSWQGVTPFTCGAENFDSSRQRVIKKIQTRVPEMDKRVAETIRPGYEWDGKILRPEMVAVYVYSNETTEKGGN